MKVYTYLILYSYIVDFKGVERNGSTFYYTDKKISDYNLEEAKLATDLIMSDIQQKAETNNVTISDIKLIE